MSAPASSLSDFIKENYTYILYPSEEGECDLENFTELYFGDNHSSTGHSAINSLCINMFSTARDAIFVEHALSMKQIEPEETQQSAWLKTAAPIRGWDIDFKPHFPSVSLEGLELSREMRVILGQICHIKESEKTEDLKIQLGALMAKIRKLNLENFELFSEDGGLMESINDTFQKRQLSMQASVKNVKNVAERIFVIAGYAHLIRDSDETEERDSPKSLDSMKQFLCGRNAVVLIPKAEKASIMGEKYETVCLEAEMKNRGCIIC